MLTAQTCYTGKLVWNIVCMNGFGRLESECLEMISYALFFYESVHAL